MLGRRVGDFVITAALGNGAEGTVFRARQESLEREVAVKVRARVGSAARFLDEARLASRLDHPYATHMYAFGVEEDGLAWLAMELVDGATLAAALDSDGPWPPGRFLPFFERLCEVVEHGHRRGVVHGDLKPANVVVVDRAGRLLPRLIDLGVGCSLGGAPAADAASPAYMAPELWAEATGKNARSDVYALGILAYETLSGTLPFADESLVAMARLHRQAALPPLEGPAAPAHAVLARAVAKRPDERYASALELAAALRAAFGAVDDPAPPALDEATRDATIRHAPQPLAEAVAALEAAATVPRAAEAVQLVGRVLSRWLAVVALAARAHVRDGAPSPSLSARLRLLRTGTLAGAEWLELAREAASGTHGVPELAGLRALPSLARLLGPAPAGRVALEAALEDVDTALRATSFLAGYELAVANEGRFEAWTGVRRRDRRPIAARGPAPEDGDVCLVHLGERRVELAPLAQALPPGPGAERELFLLEGGGRRGARMRAWPAGFERQDEAVWSWLRAHGADTGDAGAEDAVADDTPPYRGLEPFGREDRDRFVGREREVEAFLNRLRVEPLLVLAGPSGVGKSSFLHAGVVASLEGDWTVISVRPSTTPLATLAARLDGLRTGRALLIVDQMEELFTLCADPAERAAYAAAVVAARARVVLALRDDFLARLEELPALHHRVARALELLGRPPAEDLRRVLVEPARRAGYHFEDDEIPDRMVAEVLGRPAALPLLSFTARAMWDLRDRVYRVLPRRAHDDVGGVAGALARHADATLAACAAPERAAVRELFRHLVNREGTRVPLRRGDALAVMGAGAEGILERLITARLLVAGEQHIELVHEALVEGWPRLREWIREDLEWARLRDQLRAAARQWVERGRPRGLLWRDDAFEEYRVWRGRYPGRLTADEEAFARASAAEAARGRRVRLAGVVAVLLALSAAVVFLWRDRQAERRRGLERLVEQGRQLLLDGEPRRALPLLAEARRGGLDDLATRVLLRDAARPLAARRLAIRAHEQPIVAAFYSGRAFVTAGRDGVARVWDAETGAPLRVLAAGGPIMAAAADPRGRFLVTGGRDRWVSVWDAPSGALVRMLPVRSDVWELRVSHDGALLAASAAREVLLWDTDGFRPRAAFPHGAAARALAFSPDDAWLATGDHDGRVRLFDVARGVAVAEARQGARVWEAAFAPDGARLYTASEDRTVVTWSLPALARLQVIHGHSDGVVALALAADGATLLTGGLDGSANLVDVAAGEVRRRLPGHHGPVRRVGFDGDIAMTLGHDGAAILWAPSGRALARFPHGAALLAGQLRPGGGELLTGSMKGVVSVWRTSPTEVAAAWPALDSPVAFTAARELTQVGPGSITRRREGSARAETAKAPAGEPLAFDGSHAVIAVPGGAVLWDVASGAEVALPASASQAVVAGERALLIDGASLAVWDGGALTALPPRAAPLRAAAFGGGALALSGSRNIEIWRGGAPVKVLEGHAGNVFDVAWCPSGDRLLSGADDLTARWWDATAGTTIATLQPHGGPVIGVAVAPGCHLAATASGDGAVRLWDLPSGRLLSEHSLGDVVRFLAFSPDGARLAAATPDEIVVWFVETDDLPESALDALLASLRLE